MKAIDNRLPDADEIEIHIFADEHIGDSMADFKRLMKRIEYVANTPNAYCVLGGDLMDTAVRTSIGDTYAETHTPMEQLRECVRIFEPLAPKILAVVHGNHENRVYKSDGFDITEIMCSQLGIIQKYEALENCNNRIRWLEQAVVEMGLLIAKVKGNWI